MAEQYWPVNLPPSARRPCAQDDFDSAEVFRVADCGFHQGQERNPLGPGVWGADAKRWEAEFLGARLFRVDDWSLRGHDSGLSAAADNREQEDKRPNRLNLWR
jgi:hypothetical protein